MNIMVSIAMRELRANAKLLLGWSVVIVLFNIAGVMKFEGIAAGDPESVRALTDAFPKVALAVMGIADLDMSTFAGYYAVLEFYTGIMVAVIAVAFARNAVSREIVDGTYEFLFVRPVTRGSILIAKFTAALLDMVTIAAVNLASSIACLRLLKNAPDGGVTVVWRFSLWLLVMMLIFGAIGACAAAICARPERGPAIGNGSVIVAYGAGVVYDMFSDHDASVVARILSPFRYVTPDEVIHGDVMPLPFAALTVVIVVIGVMSAYYAFCRRDLSVE